LGANSLPTGIVTKIDLIDHFSRLKEPAIN